MDRKRRNIALFYAVFFLQGMVFYSPVATLYRQASGLSLLQIGAIESISLGLMVALEIPWGRWADALGHRKTLVFCCALFALSKVIFWRAHTFGGFLAERVVLSVTLAGLSGCDSAFLFSCCSDTGERRRAFSRWEAVQTAGMLLAALSWPLLQGNYRLAALLTVLSYTAAALLALGWTEPEVGKVAAAGTERPRIGTLLLGTRRLAPILLAFCLLDQTAQMGTVFLNQLQYLRAGIDQRWFGALQAAAAVVGLSGGLSHRLTRRLGERRAGTALMAAGGVACAVMAAWAGTLATVAGVMTLRAVRALCTPLSLTIQNELAPPAGRAAQLSCNAMLLDLCALALNPVFGALADTGVGTALAFGVACCGVGSAVFWQAAPADCAAREGN